MRLLLVDLGFSLCPSKPRSLNLNYSVEETAISVMMILFPGQSQAASGAGHVYAYITDISCEARLARNTCRKVGLGTSIFAPAPGITTDVNMIIVRVVDYLI